MSDTPRTDCGMEFDDSDLDSTRNFARQLEHELNAANERIKRLEIAGDTLATVTLRNGRSHDQWHAAKEAKP
jgi:hypothetical protein